MEHIKKLFQTDETNTILLILRIVAGSAMFAHGAQKLLGIWGGYGFSGTMQGMTGMGLPAVVVFLIIIGESFGAVGVFLGLLSRVGAFGNVLIQIGAIFIVHLSKGFFMPNGGFELNYLFIGLFLPVMIWGGGRYSVDAWVAKKLTV